MVLACLLTSLTSWSPDGPAVVHRAEAAEGAGKQHPSPGMPIMCMRCGGRPYGPSAPGASKPALGWVALPFPAVREPRKVRSCWHVHKIHCRIGEARKPGPESRQVMSVNVTSLGPAVDVLLGMTSSVFLVHEHSIALKSQDAVSRSLKAKQLQVVMSPPDPESAKPSGGVAILAKRGQTLQACKPRSAPFESGYELGRLVMAMVTLGPRTTVLCISAYGWAGKHHDHDRHARTDALVEAIEAELLLWPDMPVFIGADFNATTADLPTLSWKLEAGHWHDMGSIAPVWGREAAVPTCRAHNARVPTRTDMLICNCHALPIACDFWHFGFGIVDVHARIAVSFKSSPPQPVGQWVAHGSVDLKGIDAAIIEASIDGQFAAAYDVLRQQLQAETLDQLFLHMVCLHGKRAIEGQCRAQRGWEGHAQSREGPTALGY